MRYCSNCGRMTPGSARFCNGCGRSYDDKFCPRLHQNGRDALICSTCGSRELTTPQPKTSLFVRYLLPLLHYSAGLLLLILSVAFLAVYVSALIVQSELSWQFMVVSLTLGLAWLLYIKAAPVLRTKTNWRNRESQP